MVKSAIRPLGNFVRTLRQARGYPSARQLSLSAGLSDAQVGLVERGVFRPRWSTFARILDALGLTGAERSEAIRLWTEAGLPPAARESPAPAFPGEAVWRHFPAAALSRFIPRTEPLHTVNALGFLPCEFRALASLLAWGALCSGKPAARLLARTRSLARALAEREEGIVIPPGQPAQPCYQPAATRVARAAVYLPALWQAVLLSRETDSNRLAGAIAAWAFTNLGDSTERIRVEFRGAAELGAHNVTDVQPALCAAVFDTLTRCTLWDRAKLSDEFGSFDPQWHVCSWRAAAADLARIGDGTSRALPSDRLPGAVADLHFARRLFALPGVGEVVLGFDLVELDRRIAALESVLNAVRAGPDSSVAPAPTGWP